MTAVDPAQPSNVAASQISVDDGWVPRPIVIKVHEMHHGRTLQDFGVDNISVVRVTDELPADLVLWTTGSIEGQALQAVIDEYDPIPVFVVLDTSKRPAHISRCLQAGAIQCLIDPPRPLLIAHIHAIFRRRRARQ